MNGQSLGLASGPESCVYHRYAQRYVEILRDEGVKVEEHASQELIATAR